MSDYIPKILFQTSKAKLDQYLIDMIQHNLTDGWEYKHYTDSEILTFFKENPDDEFPDITQRFLSIKRGEHKADLFRYYHLYVKGGLFMDSDAMIYEPVNAIIKNYKFVSVHSTIIQNIIFQGIIASEPKNPLLYQALKSVYTLNLSLLDKDYHYLCKELYTQYKNTVTTIDDLCTYKLYRDASDVKGDKILDDDGNIIFRHFWRNKEHIPNYLPSLVSYRALKPSVKVKNLVYFCVFYNENYFKLLALLLKSLKFYSKQTNFDLLIVTNNEFKHKIYELCSNLNIYISIYCINFTTIFQAACARLFIFDYENIDQYTNILYLDTDIIIKQDLTPIFNLELKDVLYGLECGTIASPSFGSQFFDFNTISSSTSGINSGTLLFKNSATIRDLFTRIKIHIQKHTDSNLPVPYCMDQPFINYHAIKDSLYDNKLLNPLVSLYEGNDTVTNYETSSICHFSYPIGNFQHKYERMIVFLDKILNTEITSLAIPDCLDRKYSWGSGYIKFKRTHLETTWGSGSYKILDTNIVCAYWKNHYHILQFNETFTKYLSIRTLPKDFNTTEGDYIKDSNLTIYGDSHAYLSFKGLQIPNRNLFHYAITMHRVGRDKTIFNYKITHPSKDTIFCLAYGEVDVRCHIGKQVNLGRHHQKVCEDLVYAYFETIKLCITEYKAIIIVGIICPTDYNDHAPCNIHTEITGGPLPFVGTNSDRVIYTQCMNSLLQEYCIKFGYTYFNPYSYYTREDGCLDYTMSDKCIHLSNNSHFIEQFVKVYSDLNLSA